jgi:hypothetical protein
MRLAIAILQIQIQIELDLGFCTSKSRCLSPEEQYC